MNRVEFLIIIIVASLFILSAYKVYQNSKLSKAGLGCAGCRIADSCQKAQNVNRLNK